MEEINEAIEELNELLRENPQKLDCAINIIEKLKEVKVENSAKWKPDTNSCSAIKAS